jgi:hypothetical protein
MSDEDNFLASDAYEQPAADVVESVEESVSDGDNFLQSGGQVQEEIEASEEESWLRLKKN